LAVDGPRAASENSALAASLPTISDSGLNSGAILLTLAPMAGGVRRRALTTSAATRACLAALLVAAAFSACRRAAEVESRASGQPAVEASRFSARLEKSDTTERLTVSVRLRANTENPIDCYVFVVASSTRAAPRTWAIWPVENPGSAISAGGHFHAAHPTTGHPLSLGRSWTRVDATLPRTPGQPPFDSVVVYVVDPKGEVLLARPFPL
jgi:hypothetical protein